MNASDPVLNLSGDDVAEMDDFGLCDHVWQIVTDAYYDQNPNWAEEEPECNSPESVFASKLSPHWSAAYAVHAFGYDFFGGGLTKLFFNQDGSMNESLPKAFELVGAPEYVTPFKEAVGVFDSFSDTLYNANWDHTQEEYEAEDARFTEALSAPDKKLWDLTETREPRTFLAAHLRENIAQYQTGANKTLDTNP